VKYVLSKSIIVWIHMIATRIIGTINQKGSWSKCPAKAVKRKAERKGERSDGI
jgi:hypothetical protein